MSIAPEIRERLIQWLDRKISLQQFEDWFVPATWNLHLENDPEAESLADEIELNLSEYSDKVLSSDELRVKLARIARPFARVVEMRYGVSRVPQDVALDVEPTRKQPGSSHWMAAPQTDVRVSFGG